MSTDAELAELRERVSAFVPDTVIPAEGELGLGAPSDELRARLQQAAREAGVFVPDLELDMAGQSVVFEAAGYSLLGPLALNCAAPDEGNMHLLSAVATPEQQGRPLQPLAAGDVRSCCAMTEPPPGAGSDPAALKTTATRDGGEWRIDGHKWLITGAAGAAFAIVMARTGEGSAATMFLVDADTPGFEARTRQRELFGTPLQELGLAQQLIADSVIDIEASRGLIRHAVGVIDAGGRGRQESSVAKTFVSEAVDRVVDRAIQLCGGAGVTHETPLGRFMNEVRAFRIYDGPAETHRWAIARREVRRAASVT